MITRINHEIRKQLELPLEEYVLADVVRQFKKPTTAVEIAEEVAMKPEEVAMILFSLCDRGYVEQGKKSKKFSSTSLWKSATKEQKEDKQVNPIINLMRLALLSEDRVHKQTDYYWDGGKDAKLAEEIAAKLSFSYRTRFNEEPEIDDIVNSFCLLLDNLPEWHRKQFSMSRINSDYNGIVNQIKSSYRQPPPKSIDDILSDI